MNSHLTIRPWSVVTFTLSRLARSAWTSRAKASAKAARLAFLILPSAFLLLSPVRAEVPSATALPPVDHYVHLSFLPKASELAQDAKMNNLTILRIDELADRVIVSYKYPDGRTATLGYMLLGSEGTAAAPQQPAAVTSSANVSTARYTVAARDPEVIYVSRPTTTVYYTDPYYYNAWAPWTVGFGVGWSSAYYGSYYRPYPYYGYYGGGHYHGGHHGGHGGYHSSGGYGRGGGGGGHSSGSHGGGGRGRR
jgi:hypothetical protein